MKPPIVVQTASNSRFRHFLVNFREFLNRHENAAQRGGIYKEEEFTKAGWTENI